MATASYICPCCGGPLKFSGESGKLEPERGRSICTKNGKAVSALLPVWLITTEKEGKTYQYAFYQ